MSEKLIGVIAHKDQDTTIKPIETTLSPAIQTALIDVSQALDSWNLDHGRQQPPCSLFYFNLPPRNNKIFQLLVITIPFKDEINRRAIIYVEAPGAVTIPLFDQIAVSTDQEKLKNNLSQLIEDPKDVEKLNNAFLSDLIILPDPANNLLEIKNGQYCIKKLDSTRVEYCQLLDNKTIDPPQIIPPSPPTPITTEIIDNKSIETTLIQIDSRIKDRKIGGKFVGGITIHGEEFSPPGHNSNNRQDFHMLPYENGYVPRKTFPDFMSTIDPKLKILHILYYLRLQSPISRNIQLDNTLIINFITDQNNQNRVHVMWEMPVHDVDASSRPVHFTAAYFNCSKHDWQQLRSIGDIDPNNWEKILNTTFSGINQATKRRSVSNLALVDVDRLIPDHLIKHIQGGDITGNDIYHIARTTQLDLTAISKRSFSKPLPAYS